MGVTTLTPNPWRYKEDVTGHSSGFQAEAFDDSSWDEGPQAFGKNDLSYGGPIATPWLGSNNDLCARATFSVPADAVGVRILATIDFEGEVWVNGVSEGTVLWSDSPYKVLTLSSWNVGDNLVAARAHADDQQNRLAVLVEIVYPDEPDAWDVFDKADPNGPILVTLTNAYGRSFRDPLNDAGKGALKINRYAAEVAHLQEGNIVKARIPELGDDYVFAFELQDVAATLAHAAEKGAEELTFSGPGVFAYLNRAEMIDRAFTTGLDINDTWLKKWSKSTTNPVGSAVVSTDQAFVYVINATDRKVRKIRQSDRAVVRTSPALWSGSDNYAGGLSADPSDDTILWALEAPWSLGGSGNTKIRKVRISDWAILATYNLGSATKLSAIKASSGHLWTTKFDGSPDWQKRDKSDGSVVSSGSISYNGNAQVNATGVSINGTKIAWWFLGKQRALIASTGAPGTITQVIKTTGLTAFGGDWTTESGNDFFYPVSYTADRLWKYQLTTSTPRDPVDGKWRLDEGNAIAIAHRLVSEWQAPARPVQPIPDLTIDFSPTLDSNGDTAEEIDGVLEYAANIGDKGMPTMLRLSSYGPDFRMSPYLRLSAYNSFGTNRSSATFAAGKVRLQKGVSIVEDVSRRINARKLDTYMLAEGDGRRFEEAVLNDQGGAQREGYVKTDQTDRTALQGTAEAELAEERRKAESAAIGVRWGDDELNGKYLPYVHYLPGDTIRAHTGTGPQDYNESSLRIAAIQVDEGVAKDWSAKVELQSGYLMAKDAAGGGSSGGGSAGGTGSGGSGSGGGTSSITVRDSETGDEAVGAQVEIDAGVTQEGPGVIGINPRPGPLDDMTNVEAGEKVDGDVLVWDATLEAWVARTVPVAAHGPTHEVGGGDEVFLEGLATIATDTSLVPHPDGAGGIQWGADATGGGGGGSGAPLARQVNFNSGSNVASVAVPLPVTPLASSIFVMFVAQALATLRTISSITQTNVTWTAARGVQNGTTARVDVWVGVGNGATPGTTATVNFAGGNSANADAALMEYPGGYISSSPTVDSVSDQTGSAGSQKSGFIQATAAANLALFVSSVAGGSANGRLSSPWPFRPIEFPGNSFAIAGYCPGETGALYTLIPNWTNAAYAQTILDLI